jgi:plasmid stability protein
MLELPPDLEHQLREQAALDGKDVNDYLRLILQQMPRSNGTAKLLTPEDYPDEGKDWTEEDLQIDLAWAQSQKRVA